MDRRQPAQSLRSLSIQRGGEVGALEQRSGSSRHRPFAPAIPYRWAGSHIEQLAHAMESDRGGKIGRHGSPLASANPSGASRAICRDSPACEA